MYNHFSSVTKSLEKKKIIIHRFNHSNPEVRMQKEKKTNKTAVRARGGSLSFTQCGKEFARLALRAHRSSKDQFDEVVNNFFYRRWNKSIIITTEICSPNEKTNRSVSASAFLSINNRSLRFEKYIYMLYLYPIYNLSIYRNLYTCVETPHVVSSIIHSI